MSLNIVVSYQNSVPQGFKDGMQAAANISDSLILRHRPLIPSAIAGVVSEHWGSGTQTANPQRHNE
jgi:hypothetical protein